MNFNDQANQCSVLCEQLDLDKLTTNNNGQVELTAEGKEKALTYSEGNKYLYEVLTSCWKHGIKTYACCSGHEGNINEETTNCYPYVGMILDENSLPYVRKIIAGLQGIEDWKLRAGLIQKEETWGDEVPDKYKAFTVYGTLPNRCEVFYKLARAIESKTLQDVPLSFIDNNGISGEEFYQDVVSFLDNKNMEELSINDPLLYGNWPQELIQLQYYKGSFWQRIKDNKIVRRIIETISPNQKKKRLAIAKYTIAQTEYNPTLEEELSFSKSESTEIETAQENVAKDFSSKEGR